MLTLVKDIAASIYIKPCTEKELLNRTFLKNISLYGVQSIIMQLERAAIYYKDNTMHIYKKWAKKNLKEYELF